MSKLNHFILISLTWATFAFGQNYNALSSNMNNLRMKVDSLVWKVDSIGAKYDTLQNTTSIDSLSAEGLKRDNFLRNQLTTLQSQLDSMKSSMAGLLKMEAQLKELQVSDSIRTAKELADKEKLLARQKELSSEYKMLKYTVDDYSVKLTPNLDGWSLGFLWSKSDPVPNFKLDSLGNVDALELDRVAVWIDNKVGKAYRYGFMEVESDNYAITGTTDWYFTTGAGLGGSYQSGFDGWFSEFGTGIGLLMAYCDFNKDLCYETAKGKRLESTLIGLTTQIRVGWNFIPGHYFESFRRSSFLGSLGLSVSGMWRGVWGVAGYVDGESKSPTKLMDAFFEENSAFILGNIYRIEFSLTSQF